MHPELERQYTALKELCFNVGLEDDDLRAELRRLAMCLYNVATAELQYRDRSDD